MRKRKTLEHTSRHDLISFLGSTSSSSVQPKSSRLHNLACVVYLLSHGEREMSVGDLSPDPLGASSLSSGNRLQQPPSVRGHFHYNVSGQIFICVAHCAAAGRMHS